jgi:cell division protein ZapA (FtsZ GTPase activity inhibitor)
MSRLHDRKVHGVDDKFEGFLADAKKKRLEKKSNRAHKLRKRVTQLASTNQPIPDSLKKVMSTLNIEKELEKAERKRAKAEKKAQELEKSLKLEPSNISQVVTGNEVPQV